MTFINNLMAEYIKTKRSAALWVCLIVGGFVPAVMLIEALINGGSINQKESSWESVFGMSWIVMANFLLPMGVIIATSLIVQIENKNNGWKQVHAAPISYGTMYLSKLAILFIMTLQFILIFVILTIISCTIATLVNDGKLPHDSLPIGTILNQGGQYLFACLPIIAIQFGLSLKFKNIILPMGVGLLGVIGAAIGLSWDYIQYIPYSHPLMEAQHKLDGSLHWYTIGAFVIISILSFLLYRSKKDFG